MKGGIQTDPPPPPRPPEKTTFKNPSYFRIKNMERYLVFVEQNVDHVIRPIYLSVF